MSQEINNQILRVIGCLGFATRMEIFHSFDGKMDWPTLKRRMGFLQHQGKLKTISGNTPDRPKLWTLTNTGENIVKDLFPQDQPTETVEK